MVPITSPTEYRMMSSNDQQRDPFHHPEQHEHVGDHHGREQLDEVLDPQVHDPEAPVVRDRERIAGARQQPDLERGDRGAPR